jgi:ribosome biogenesis GTPase
MAKVSAGAKAASAPSRTETRAESKATGAPVGYEPIVQEGYVTEASGTVLRAMGGGLYEVHLEGVEPGDLPPLVDTMGQHIVDEDDEPEDGLILLCAMGGRLKKGPKRMSQPIAVGDRVRVRPLPNTGENSRGQRLREGFIEEVLERERVLGRSRYNKTAQVTVANLDQVVIVMAMRMPDLSTHRLDRFLVLAEASDLRAVICLNKVDLLKKKEVKAEVEPLIERYEKAGYTVLPVAAETDKGIKKLRRELSGHISAFIGSSGVGKSSLVMALEPDLMLWVGEVMDIGKGRHTTTEVSLHPLEGGGYIADTPGIKTVTLLEQQEVFLPNCFPEFRRVSVGCRFNDCTHVHEPLCAVRAEVEKGEISQERYDSYLKMREDDLLKLRLTQY